MPRLPRPLISGPPSHTEDWNRVGLPDMAEDGLEIDRLVTVVLIGAASPVVAESERRPGARPRQCRSRRPLYLSRDESDNAAAEESDQARGEVHVGVGEACCNASSAHPSTPSQGGESAGGG
jgi:hypothetical protein